MREHRLTHRRRRRASGPITRAELESKALSYLDRFDASKARVRQVLRGYVARAASEEAIDQALAEQLITEVVERFAASGILDDARFSVSLASGLRRRGASHQAIVEKLRGRGVDESTAKMALAEVDRDVLEKGSFESPREAEIEAARALVRRRRLGPFRPAAEQSERRQRDLGVLARAGFSPDVARQALGDAGGDDDE